MSKPSLYRSNTLGPVKRYGARYVGSDGAGVTIDSEAIWQESFMPVEFRTYLYPGPSNVVTALLPQANDMPLYRTSEYDGYAWVQTQLHRQFIGSACVMRIAFYTVGGGVVTENFQFSFGARAWADGELQDQAVTMYSQNITVTASGVEDRVFYVDSPSIPIDGTPAAGNFLYLKVKRSDDNAVCGYLPMLSLRVKYPLSGNYVL
jgi:hypothetical protein